MVQGLLILNLTPSCWTGWKNLHPEHGLFGNEFLDRRLETGDGRLRT